MDNNADLLAKEAGCSFEEARIALNKFGGSFEEARDFLLKYGTKDILIIKGTFRGETTNTSGIFAVILRQSDRKLERFPGLRREHLAAGEADAPRRRLRIDAGAKQCFAGVDIADAGDETAVHQSLLDRDAAVARLAVQPRAVEPGAERLGADVLQQRVRSGASCSGAASAAPTGRTEVRGARLWQAAH